MHVTATCANRVTQEKTRASFHDRKSHAEACTQAFVAEHSLPLAMVPHIIKYAQMSRDQKVLENLSMERQTATYKLKEGLSLCVQKRFVLEMRKSKFSLNLDEATSNNNQKVLTVLVSFFSESLGETVIDYYDSVSLTAATARTLYEAVRNLLERDEIPAANLVSVLTDSVNYMRGNRSGFQKLLRDNFAPHLLDIGGDVCHHVHNICKKFCSYSDQEVECLLDDIHTDFQFHQDLRTYLRELCLMLDVKFEVPKERASHPWCSQLDVLMGVHRMWDALTLLYFAWVPKASRYIYQDLADAITSSLKPSEQKRVKEIQSLASSPSSHVMGWRGRNKVWSASSSSETLFAPSSPCTWVSCLCSNPSAESANGA